MNPEIQMHDVVALLEEIPATHFSAGKPLLLRRGQIGTVVMTYDGTAFEIEFCDTQGRAFAILPIPTDRLILLYEGYSIEILNALGESIDVTTFLRPLSGSDVFCVRSL